MPKKMSALLITAALSGVTLTGCASLGSQQRAASFADPASHFAPRIEKALDDRKFPQALTLAEELVAAQPDNAGNRVLLGRSYLANGRYLSARTAFMDAMTLGNSDVRTIVSLALCETALGNGVAARALLSDHIEHLPAGDYGLAVAMAGDAQEGVRALLEAVRQPGATARTRQNLAYALALGGAWGQARLIAGQDLSAKDAERRIGQWSQALAQADPGQRVAALTGIAPRADDAGMPVHLALRNDEAPAVDALALVAQEQPAVAVVAPIAAADEAMAPAEAPVALVRPVAVQPVAIPPSLRPMQSSERQDAKPAPQASVAPSAQLISTAPLLLKPQVELSASSPVAQDIVRASFQLSSMAEAPSVAPRQGTVQTAAASMPTGLLVPASDRQASDWVVQLGAFNSASVAREKWQAMSRSGPLAHYREILSQTTVDGRVFHRVAVRGFADRSAANAFCGALSAKGQPCFVRLDDSGTTRMARANAVANPQIASR